MSQKCTGIPKPCSFLSSPNLNSCFFKSYQFTGKSDLLSYSIIHIIKIRGVQMNGKLWNIQHSKSLLSGSDTCFPTYRGPNLELFVKIPCTSRDHIHGPQIVPQKKFSILSKSAMFSHDSFVQCTVDTNPILINLYLHCLLWMEIPV